MRKKFNIVALLVLFSAVIIYSCKKDDLSGLNPTDEELNRSFMAVFRYQGNTGNSSDPYACKVVNTNDMYLVWNGINDASGYRIKMKLQSGSWEVPEDILMDTIVGPDVLKMTIEDLQYSTMFSFAIQTLSPLGEQYNSKWYGYGDGGHNDDRAEFTMEDRLGIPDVMSVSDVTENSMRVYFDLTARNAGTDDPTILNPTFQYEEVDGEFKFLIDQIKVEPSATNRDLESFTFNLTAEDIERGYIDVYGLTSNAMYVVNGLNNNIERYWDRLYNTTMVRMKGQIGEPILIPHIVDTTSAAIQYNASRLDTILANYINDNTLAEGTIFLLESGKTYYMGSHPIIAKGYTLKSENPDNRATVLMGIGEDENGNPMTTNFMFGRNALSGEIGGITIGEVIFSDINFDAPNAYNYYNNPNGPGTGTGNYFVNQFSGAMPFTCSKFEVRNCDFKRMVRGWVRTQGTNRQVIEEFLIEGCLFHDCGMHTRDGRGYSFIHGDAKNPGTNIFKNLIIRNNSFIGISYDHMIKEQHNYAWAPHVVWNVTIENNTFVNAFSVSNGRYIITHRYPPVNSKYVVKNNLFIAAKKPGDDRLTTYRGMDFRAYSTGLTFDVDNNYSTAKEETISGQIVSYWSGDDIFASDGFSSTKRGANGGTGDLNIPGPEAAVVKTGATPITPGDLLVDPYPIGMLDDTDMNLYNLDGMYFKNTDEVRNHPIYTEGIGDPRWRR